MQPGLICYETVIFTTHLKKNILSSKTRFQNTLGGKTEVDMEIVVLSGLPTLKLVLAAM
jgi:hypothetical protein